MAQVLKNLKKAHPVSDMHTPKKAPELIVSKWLNSDEQITIESLRGKVVMVVAFQMLCPSCVEVSIPQAKKVSATFSPNDVVVIGLHTVFEHHEAMQENSLKAFLHEYRVNFPVAIDKPSERITIPETMNLYNMQGTPTTLLIDRQGRLRKHQFGHTPDLLLGAEIMALVLEKDSSFSGVAADKNNVCSNDACC